MKNDFKSDSEWLHFTFSSLRMQILAPPKKFFGFLEQSEKNFEWTTERLSRIFFMNYLFTKKFTPICATQNCQDS